MHNLKSFLLGAGLIALGSACVIATGEIERVYGAFAAPAVFMAGWGILLTIMGGAVWVRRL